MEHINEQGELTMSTNKTDHESGSIKFFAIVGGISFAFGVMIALFDLMYNPVFSALLSLMFIFIGSACLMVASAKFLQGLDKHAKEHDQRHH